MALPPQGRTLHSPARQWSAIFCTYYSSLTPQQKALRAELSCETSEKWQRRPVGRLESHIHDKEDSTLVFELQKLVSSVPSKLLKEKWCSNYGRVSTVVTCYCIKSERTTFKKETKLQYKYLICCQYFLFLYICFTQCPDCLKMVMLSGISATGYIFKILWSFPSASAYWLNTGVLLCRCEHVVIVASLRKTKGWKCPRLV